MNARNPKTVLLVSATSPTMLLLELEMPRTTAFEAFEEQLNAQLAALETRFGDFVTPKSFAGSIGR